MVVEGEHPGQARGGGSLHMAVDLSGHEHLRTHPVQKGPHSAHLLLPGLLGVQLQPHPERRQTVHDRIGILRRGPSPAHHVAQQHNDAVPTGHQTGGKAFEPGGDPPTSWKRQ